MRGNYVGGKRGALWKVALAAGFIGGIAEIGWVGIYCYSTGLSSTEVARQVAASVTLSAAPPAAPLFGVLIHFALSLALAAGYAVVVWRPLAARFGTAVSMLIAIAVLAAIWAVNFLLLLPVLNPGFVDLMPYPVTLASKILFGICMASAFERADDRKSVQTQGATRMLIADAR